MQVTDVSHPGARRRECEPEPESEDVAPLQRNGPQPGPRQEPAGSYPSGASADPAAATAPRAPSTTLAELAAQPNVRVWRDRYGESGVPIKLPRSRGDVPPAPLSTAAPAVPPSPSASPQQRAMLELILADPLNRELVTAWGGSAAAPADGLATDLSARYGSDLLGRLDQLGRATATVRDLYRQAVDTAAALRPPMGAADPPGWSTTTEGSGESFSMSQRFSVDAFTAWYAQQDTLASRAFAQLYGRSQTTTTQGSGVDSAQTTRIDIGGGLFTLQPGQWIDTSYSANGDQPTWIVGRIGSDVLTQLDPAGNPELHDRSAVWFDPAAGWVTVPQNIVTHIHEGWFDHVMDTVGDALPVVVVGVMTWATAGAFGVAGGAGMAGAATVGEAAAAGAAFGAIGSAYSGLFNNGRIDFKDVLRGALSGAVTAGLAKELQGTQLGSAGLDQYGNVTSYALRALSITGQATLQGALQELLGGKFKDGFTNGLTQGLAREIGNALNSKIAELAKNPATSPAEISALRLLSQATGSAIRVLGNPNDPASAFAADFLNSLVQDALPAAPGAGAQPVEPVFDDAGNAMPVVLDPLTSRGYLVPNEQHDQVQRELDAELGIDPERVLYDDGWGAFDDRDPNLHRVGTIDEPARGGISAADYATRLAARVGGELAPLFQRGLQAAADFIALGDVEALKSVKADIQGYLDARAERGGLSEAEIKVFGALYAASEALFPTNLADFAGGVGKAIGAAAGVIKIGGKAGELASVVRVESRAAAGQKIADTNAQLSLAAQRANPALRGPELAGKTEGAAGGVWGHPPEPRGVAGAEYSEQVTGVARGTEYNLNGTWFEGYDTARNVVIDAKDWAGYVLPEKKFWVDAVLKSAESETKAVIGTGAKIEWRVSTQEAADAINKTLIKNDYGNIKVVVVPKKGP